ncbi:OLC1v1007928C1 [Oldenlandia corymbosa var. corymbosa]|uniref:Caffeic acid 3-O-methyltransferase n=1 Tax=Oldenlandia corymbosa var. corymbosa TaxID=529605 RepID=A0AAV1DKE3_OLDCO|nr:OLC1v1007928C1 [Oldenlandia corymbosa var. corymbosa]
MENLAKINYDPQILEEDQHFSYAMMLITSMSLPMVLKAAVRLGLFEIIAGAAGEQLSSSQIASKLSSPTTPTNQESTAGMVDRMLRLLASHSVLTCSSVVVDGREQSVYGLAPVAKYFVRNERGVSLGPFLEFIQHINFIESWFELEEAVIEGGVPFKRLQNGAHAFDSLKKDPEFGEIFNKAMANHATLVVDGILESYKGFADLESLVDVGGGFGVTINAITNKYPNVKGINFDLPQVIEHAPKYHRVTHVSGNMFESVPNADAMFMKWILHDWDDEHCLKVLKNCYKALPANGKVIVVDAVLPMIPDTSASVKTSCQFDLIMMTRNPGGKERSEQEFLTLALRAGFKGMRLECFVCNLWVMEFYK